MNDLPKNGKQWVDWHFAKTEEVKAAYKLKDWAAVRMAGLEWAANLNHICKALKWSDRSFGGAGELPRFAAFGPLTTALIELQQFDEAEAILAKGIEQGCRDGTKGGLAGRLEKVRAKRTT